MPKLKGYLHPSGMVTLRKDWYYSDLYPPTLKTNHSSFSKSIENLLIKEGLTPYPTVKQKKKRTFKSGKHLFKRLLNASYVMQYTCIHKPCLMSLTFPKCPQKNVRKLYKKWLDNGKKGNKPTENIYISNFLDYLRDKGKSIKAGEYWWVKEYQQRGVIHYHILIDLPFIDVQRLNSLWCNVIKQHSKNALNLILHTESMKTITNYLTKYCVKSENVFKSKAYAISQGINKQQIPIFSKVFIDKLLENVSKNKNQTENGLYYGEFWNFAYVKGELATQLYFNLLDNNKLKGYTA